MSAPILKIVDPNKDFVVCTCNQGLEGVLMQDNHVVFYESRKLKEHEKNYATHDLELASIVHALKMWRHYLMGRKFVLRIVARISPCYRGRNGSLMPIGHKGRFLLMVNVEKMKWK